MNERLALDDRIGRLIATYADGAPIEVDPVVMARLAAAPRRGMSLGVRAAPTSRGVVLVAALMALLLAIVAGALLAGRQGPVDPATVIARYWNGHVGWVLVYDDGRVVLAPGPEGLPLGGWGHEGLGPHDPTGFGYIAPFERRLTPSGVELIRSGTVPVDAFLQPAGRCPDDQGVPDQTCVMVTEGQRQSLAAAWAESRYRPYVPTAYAVCFSDGVTAVNTYSSVVHPTTVSQALSMLPGPAERLLRGRERTYRDERWMDPAPRECSEVTRDDAGVLLGLLQDAGFDIDGVSPDELLGEGLEVLGEGRWGVTLWKPAWPWTQPSHSAIAVAFVPLLPNGMPWPSLGVPP